MYMHLFYVGGNSELSDKWKKEFLPEHCVSSVEVFDPATDTWSEGPELPNALCGAGRKKNESSVCFKNKFHLVLLMHYLPWPIQILKYSATLNLNLFY